MHLRNSRHMQNGDRQMPQLKATVMENQSYLHTALWEPKPLLHDSGQFPNATAFLSQDILGPTQMGYLVI